MHSLLPNVVLHLTGSECLPSCFLNVNTNAGISDCSEKTEAKQASCTSVHSSDQYFSTHTDTPDGKHVDSDNEVSPAFSFTDEAAEKAVLSPHTDSDPVVSTSCDQVIKPRPLDKDKRAETESSRHRGHKNNGEEASNEEMMKADTSSRSNQGTLGIAQDDHQLSKHKKKLKTTETVYIKFESSMSKKVTTTTTVLKDTKRPAINKSRTDTSKQLQAPDDGQKAISSLPEKADNRLMLETPRHTKIVRCPEGYHDGCEDLAKSNDEVAWPSATSSESGPKKTTAHSLVRATGSDNHLHRFRTPPLPSCTPDSLGKTSSVSERTTSQRSPKRSYSPVSSHDSRRDLLDSDYASERESSAATIVNGPKMSPRNKTVSVKEGREEAIRNDSVHKLDKSKQSDCSLKEVRNVAEKRDRSKATSPNRESGRSRLETEGRDNSYTGTRSQSPKPETSTEMEASRRKRSLTKHIGSPQKRSFCIIGKHDGKKLLASKLRSRTTDDTSTKEDVGEVSTGKVPPQLTCGRKRSPGYSKTQSRSPELKRRKRSAKKSLDGKSSKSPDLSKLDKSKKPKSADKTADKKKKKKKQKQKADSVDKLSPTKKGQACVRNRSKESCKTPQVVPSSISGPQFIDTLMQHLSPGGQRKGEASKVSQQVDDDNSTRSREIKFKNRAASSAENVSMCEGVSKPIRAAESVPTFTGTVYTSITKVVQVASCPKVKKSERDLQQAELGWNSSKFSAEERAAVEQLKQNQRRIKARYYLMKPKGKSKECEQSCSQTRRTVSQRSQADGDTGIRQLNDTSDSSQTDKTRLGQGKSVQFSESTEDHEASRDETGDEYLTFQDSQESDGSLAHTANKFTIVLQPSGKTVVLTQPINKTTSISLSTVKSTGETAKPANKWDAEPSQAVNKSTGQRKEEPRSQTTPPRRRRPVWQTKACKEKVSINAKTQPTGLKSVPALVSIKQRQSSDNILKPPGRLQLGLFYPGRSKMQSPSFNNISQGDKRTVAYNTWINSNVMVVPMNKATRKLVAKTGSPVDIKEIIEGSSVDAADYQRSKRTQHELGVRAAKSVPSLGPRPTTSTDGAGSKRVRLHSGSQKKNKVYESSSARSLSSVDAADEAGFSSKNRSIGVEVSVSPASSTDVDNGPGLKYRVGSSRFTDHGYPRKKKEKHGKKFAKGGPGKWHTVNAQDVHSVPDLTRLQYYGDVPDVTSLNTGLSWVVQSVFSRLPFLSQRQAPSANASGDMPVGQVGE